MYMNNMNTMTMMMMMMFTIYSSQFTFTKTTSYEGNIVYKCVCVSKLVVKWVFAILRQTRT